MKWSETTISESVVADDLSGEFRNRGIGITASDVLER